MRRWFERVARSPKIEPGLASHGPNLQSGLGQTRVVCPALPNVAVPAACIGIAIGADGSSQRYAAGQVIPLPDASASALSGLSGFWVSPGPWHCQLCLHPATPEIVLKMQWVLDSPDPRVDLQRFDLFLASEMVENDLQNSLQNNLHSGVQNRAQSLSLAALQIRLEQGLQAELAAGNIECGACMTLPEWMRFRAQLECWLYTRFGLTIEDCALADAGEQIDYAQMLLQRAAGTQEEAILPEVEAGMLLQTEPGTVAVPANSAINFGVNAGVNSPINVSDASPAPSAPSAPPAATPPLAPPVPSAPSAPKARSGQDTALRDAAQLRRLFLELPDFTVRWRALNPPVGFFALQQTAAQRLNLLKIQVNAMPALAWASPQQRLTAAQTDTRSAHLQDAIAAWEQAWSLLARLTLAGGDGGEGGAGAWQHERDDIDRILANLEHCLAARAALPYVSEVER